jgi:hypothetical protein
LKLVSIDLETLSLSPNAVVYDIGVATFEYSGPPVGGAHPLHSVPTPAYSELVKQIRTCSYFPDRKSQVRRGRKTDPSTIEFHNQLAYSRGQTADEYYPEPSGWIADILNSLREDCANADEIWFNGTSFDCPILKTLQEQYCFDAAGSEPLWNYKVERDLRTLRALHNEDYRLMSDHKDLLPTIGPAHTGAQDAQWNLCVRLWDILCTSSGTFPYPTDVYTKSLA